MIQQYKKILEDKTLETASKTSSSSNAIQLKNNREYSVVQQKLAENSTAITSSFTPIQRKTNNTGLPDNLKSGIENLSGHSMDDVKVHYNSDKPAQLNAHAYAQGTDIHIASRQEKHLPHEAWHVVQQKQGRVKPTLQMKGKVNVNDDTGLEKEADVMGAKALQMKLTPGTNLDNKKSNNVSNIIQNVVQRRVLINGVPKAPPPRIPVPGEYLPNHRDWIYDTYARNYLSQAEYEEHDSGRPVKCGLLETMALWYRLPFPSAIAGGPAARFFLIGENHGYTPISALLRASNQQNAKALVESSAAFRNTPMGVDAGEGTNLGTLEGNANRHHIELGLAKALHAFASMRAPTALKRRTAQPPSFVPYPIAGGAEVPDGHTMLPQTEENTITLRAWKAEAVGKTKYRNANGILYFLRDTDEGPRGVARPKSSGANNYNQGGAMEAFLRRPEIANALPLADRNAYTRVVESLPAQRTGNAYQRRYNRAFEALRQASMNNINAVYPARTIVSRSPQANVAGEAAQRDGEKGMRHRNTVMLAGLQRAIAEGGYVVASLGAQHVLDIEAWENANHVLNIPIITYNAFVKNYSAEAE